MLDGDDPICNYIEELCNSNMKKTIGSILSN